MLLSSLQVFSLCVSILVIAYGYALVIGASSSVLICKIVSVSFMVLYKTTLHIEIEEHAQLHMPIRTLSCSSGLLSL